MVDRFMKNPTIYIHLGLAKTGTTALQNFIALNKERFAEYGIYYPETGLVSNCHHGIAFYWSNNMAYKRVFKIPENQLLLLQNELSKHKEKDVIISSECLNMAKNDFQEFISLFPHNNIKFIVYLRRQDNIFESNFIEAVKGNRTYLPIDKWADSNNNINQFYSRLVFLRNFVDRKNIIVKIYEKQQFIGGSIFSDFCDIFSIKLDNSFVIPSNDFNPRLSLNALEYNRLVNTVYNEFESPYIFNQYLTAYSLIEKQNKNTLTKDYHLFSPEKRKEILKDCEDDNQKIAREFLGREDGCLFYDNFVSENISWKTYNGIDGDIAKDISAYLFSVAPSLTIQLLDRLENIESKDSYIIEAKEKLIPVLKRVIYEGQKQSQIQQKQDINNSIDDKKIKMTKNQTFFSKFIQKLTSK